MPYAPRVPELRLFWDYMTEHVERIRRVVAALQRRRARYALIGGHAVSHHGRPRLTVDVDFLVSARALPGVRAELERSGFVVRKRGEVLSAWDADADPAADEPVVDLVPAEHNRTQAEAIRGAVTATYQGIPLRVVTRPALVALKFLSAMSRTRGHGDRLQDVADISHLVKKSWKREDAREARRLVELSHPGAGPEIGRLIDDLLHDRPVTI